jgi:hypothetical protein
MKRNLCTCTELCSFCGIIQQRARVELGLEVIDISRVTDRSLTITTRRLILLENLQDKRVVRISYLHVHARKV